TNMVTVLMSNQNCTEILTAATQAGKPPLGFFHRKAAIDQHTATATLNNRTVAFTAASEGSKGQCHQDRLTLMLFSKRMASLRSIPLLSLSVTRIWTPSSDLDT